MSSVVLSGNKAFSDTSPGNPPPGRGVHPPLMGAIPTAKTPQGGGASGPLAGCRGGGAEAQKRTLYPATRTTIFTGSICPGFGAEAPKATCGETRATLVCPGDPDHFQQVVTWSCKQPGCPVCWPSWTKRASDRLVSVIEGYQAATKGKYPIRHVIFSPPPETVHTKLGEENACQWILDTFHEMVSDLGITAAAAITHPYRIKPGMERHVNDHASREHMNRYRWCLEQSDPWAFLYFSPHIHAFVDGLLEDSEQFHARTGWIYKNKGTRTGADLDRTAYYLLTHAWVKGNNKAVRYWGGMSSRNLGCDITEREEEILCPVCGSHIVRVDIGQDYQDVHNAPTAWRRVQVRSYFVRKRLKPKGVLAWVSLANP